MLNIAVLVSGGGTNLQAIIDAVEAGELKVNIKTVVSNNANAYALQRAENHHIEYTCISKKEYTTGEAYTKKLISHLRDRDVDLVVLAGFLVVLSDEFISAFRNRIICVHPSLIPAFCGTGYYGIKVHEAALERGVKVAGATVFMLDGKGTDSGPILLQKAVDVHEDDTPQTLQQRVMVESEWIILPEAIRLISENKIMIGENRI